MGHEKEVVEYVGGMDEEDGQTIRGSKAWQKRQEHA